VLGNGIAGSLKNFYTLKQYLENCPVKRIYIPYFTLLRHDCRAGVGIFVSCYILVYQSIFAMSFASDEAFPHEIEKYKTLIIQKYCKAT
jgi:hypothetical protein